MPRRSRGLDGVPHPAVGEVVVDDAAGLHGRVDGRRADEAEARPAQALRERRRLRRRRGPVGVGARRARAARGRMRPEELVQRGARLAQRDRRPGVRDRRLDLAAVADDRGVGEQPLDVALAERGRRARGRSPRMRRGTPRACAGSSATRGPTGSPRGRAARRRRARRDRPAPLLVVVGVVARVGRLPAALQLIVAPPPSRCRPRPTTG